MSNETVAAQAGEPKMQKAARALMGAASGSVLGLLLSGFFGLGSQTGAGVSIAIMVGLAVVLAIGMAMLNLRQKPAVQPVAPRIVLAGILTPAALLITVVVFLFRSAYIRTSTGSEGQIPLASPLRGALWVSLFLAAVGIFAALVGWTELRRQPGRYSGGRWIAVAILTGGACAVLVLAYLTFSELAPG